MKRTWAEAGISQLGIQATMNDGHYGFLPDGSYLGDTGMEGMWDPGKNASGRWVGFDENGNLKH